VSSHQTRSGRPAGPSATLLVSSDRPESSWSYSGGQLGVGLAPPHSFLCLALQARWAAPQQLQRSPAPPVHAAAHPTAGCAASRAGILRCGRRERHARWDAAGAVCNTVAGVTGRPGGRLSRLDASVVRNPLTVRFCSLSLAVCLSERFRSRLLTHSGCSAAVVTVMPGQYDLNETLSLVSLCTAPAVCVFGLPCGLPLNADTNHWHVKMQMW
jgi:hypothetical protein